MSLKPGDRVEVWGYVSAAKIHKAVRRDVIQGVMADGQHVMLQNQVVVHRDRVRHVPQGSGP